MRDAALIAAMRVEYSRARVLRQLRAALNLPRPARSPVALLPWPLVGVAT